MKIKDGFLLREVAGCQVVVPVGARAMDFSGMITLNSTGAILWKLLCENQTEQQLVEKLKEEFAVSEAVAQSDAVEFTRKLKEADLLE